jgi:4-aminobutyrate aminotransferase-like enzyme
MTTSTETTSHDRILADRARYVSAGVSTPKLVVSHADGARVTDVDGRTFLD